MNWKKEIITQHSRIVEVVADEEINEGQQLLKIPLQEACNYYYEGIMKIKRGEKYVTGEN
jgi:hypothetical protein